MPKLDIEKAMKELAEKSMMDIEQATALTWGGRAAASFRLSLEANTPSERLQRFYEGENYRQEAMEHASMLEDGAELLRAIHAEITLARTPALAALDRLVASR